MVLLFAWNMLAAGQCRGREVLLPPVTGCGQEGDLTVLLKYSIYK